MRRRRAEHKVIAPDVRFGSRLVQRFIHMVMKQGKKHKAQKIVYTAMELASKRLNVQDPLEVFQKAVENTRPVVELKSRRVGGATYQVPVEIRQDRGTFLALRWLRDFAHAKSGKPMEERLADELAAAYQGQGSAVKKKEDLHRMAEANRAFSHYRW